MRTISYSPLCLKHLGQSLEKVEFVALKNGGKKLSLLSLQLVGYRNGTLAVPGIGGISFGDKRVSVHLQSTEETVWPIAKLGRKALFRSC